MGQPEFPAIKTERLLLRAFAPEDADALVALCRDRLISWNTASMPYPYGRADAEAFLAKRSGQARDRNGFVYAISYDGALIGAIGISPAKEEGENVWDLGYWLGADYRGCGLMTEAVLALVAFAQRSLGADAIVAGQFIDNPASGAVLKRAGFASTGARVMMMSRGRGCEVETLKHRIDFKSDR